MSVDGNDKPKRRPNGQYETGTTGNSRGRPRRERRIPHPDRNRDMLYELALYKVPVNINGKTYDVPLVVANLLTLASKGARGDLLAARSFINAWRLAVEQEMKKMAGMERRWDNVEPAYWREKDPELRAKLKRLWDDLMNEMSGVRDLQSEPFPPRKRRRKG